MVAAPGRMTTEFMRDFPGLFVRRGADSIMVASLAPFAQRSNTLYS